MDKINLICKPILNGIMACWEKNEEAVQYIITLYINNQAIAIRTNHRTELYCSFTGLASVDGTTRSITSRLCSSMCNVVRGGHIPEYSGLDYFITVFAENRCGEIIAESERVKCTVKEF